MNAEPITAAAVRRMIVEDSHSTPMAQLLAILAEALDRAEAAETRVRDLDAVTLRLSTYIETLESANADLAGCLERAEAAEAKLARIRERIDRTYVHTRDSLRALLEDP